MFDNNLMELAAADAEEELNDIVTGTAFDLIDWWYKWYMKAGHKRLGRLLVQIYKEKG